MAWEGGTVVSVIAISSCHVACLQPQISVWRLAVQSKQCIYISSASRPYSRFLVALAGCHSVISFPFSNRYVSRVGCVWTSAESAVIAEGMCHNELSRSLNLSMNNDALFTEEIRINKAARMPNNGGASLAVELHHDLFEFWFWQNRPPKFWRAPQQIVDRREVGLHLDRT